VFKRAQACAFLEWTSLPLVQRIERPLHESSYHVEFVLSYNCFKG